MKQALHKWREKNHKSLLMFIVLTWIPPLLASDRCVTCCLHCAVQRGLIKWWVCKIRACQLDHRGLFEVEHKTNDSQLPAPKVPVYILREQKSAAKWFIEVWLVHFTISWHTCLNVIGQLEVIKMLQSVMKPCLSWLCRCSLRLLIKY